MKSDLNALLAGENGVTLHSTDDALDVMSSGLPGCIFTPEDLHPDFFDLKNGIAGDIFQKFINYNYRVAFVIPADHGYGERVTELMRDQRIIYISDSSRRTRTQSRGCHRCHSKSCED